MMMPMVQYDGKRGSHQPAKRLHEECWYQDALAQDNCVNMRVRPAESVRPRIAFNQCQSVAFDKNPLDTYSMSPLRSKAEVQLSNLEISSPTDSENRRS